MVVDDHVIDSIRRYFEDAYKELKREWITGQYEKLADCPSFNAAAAYFDAMNVLIKGCHHPDVIEGKIKRNIDEELETEIFWKQNK